MLPKVPSMPLNVTLQIPSKPIWTSTTVYSPFVSLIFSYQLYGVITKKTVDLFRLYGSRRRRFYRFIQERNQNLVYFYFIHRYLLLRTLLLLLWRFYRTNAAWTLWTWVALFTVYSSTSRRFDLYSPSSRSRVLNVDTGSPTILFGWDAATTTNQQIIIQTLDEYTFGVRRGRWREVSRKKGLSALREWVLSPATGPQESKDRLENHWQ